MINLFLALAVPGWATGDARVPRGREIYVEACAACHGSDGAGNPDWQSELRPIPFSDCGTIAEPSTFWKSIVRNGGAARGLSATMPAFGDTYSDDDLGAVIAYLRTFCEGADGYPPGDLNFRRPLKTGKAFPEVEWVLRASHRPRSAEREMELELIYENRLGPRFQYELELPFRLQSRSPGAGRGIGDLTLAGKQVLFFDPGDLSILSGGVELSLPTGSESKGLSSGTSRLTPFLSFGKAWARGRSILQGRVAFTQPFDRDRAPALAGYAVAFSRALGLPRVAWTPAVEIVGAYDLDSRRGEWAVWLEASKPLNRLGHVIASAGVQIPIRPAEASARVEFYLLWDFGDGPFWAGW